MSGKLDFFIGPPPIEGPVIGIATQLVTEFPATVVVRAGHPLAQRDELNVSDVVGARWILPAAGTVPRITYDNCFLRHGAAAPEPMFEVQPLSPAIRELILESDLVTILPRVFIREELAAGTMRALPFDDQIVFPIHLTRRQMSYPSPARDYVIEQTCRLFEELAARE
jgi:DNA-binding transcriptional LysR family regulator